MPSPFVVVPPEHESTCPRGKELSRHFLTPKSPPEFDVGPSWCWKPHGHTLDHDHSAHSRKNTPFCIHLTRLPCYPRSLDPSVDINRSCYFPTAAVPAGVRKQHGGHFSSRHFRPHGKGEANTTVLACFLQKRHWFPVLAYFSLKRLCCQPEVCCLRLKASKSLPFSSLSSFVIFIPVVPSHVVPSYVKVFCRQTGNCRCDTAQDTGITRTSCDRNIRSCGISFMIKRVHVLRFVFQVVTIDRTNFSVEATVTAQATSLKVQQ